MSSGLIRKLQGDEEFLWLNNSNGKYSTWPQLWALPLNLCSLMNILLCDLTSLAMRRIADPVSQPLLYRSQRLGASSSSGVIFLYVSLCDARKRKWRLALFNVFFSKNYLIIITLTSAEYYDNLGTKTHSLRWDFNGTRKIVIDDC